MMEIFSTIRPMQKMDIATPRWQRLTKPHWLLVEALQIPIRLKYWTFQATLGPKSLNILIIISMFFIVL